MELGEDQDKATDQPDAGEQEPDNDDAAGGQVDQPMNDASGNGSQVSVHDISYLFLLTCHFCDRLTAARTRERILRHRQSP